MNSGRMYSDTADAVVQRKIDEARAKDEEERASVSERFTYFQDHPEMGIDNG